jgi:hypothetical protein
MRNFRFWVPVIVGVLLTPVSYYFVTLSASISGALGHAEASMVAMILFYPAPFFFMILLAGTSTSDAFLSDQFTAGILWSCFTVSALRLRY